MHRLVENILFKNYVVTFEGVLTQSESLFGLSFQNNAVPSLSEGGFWLVSFLYSFVAPTIHYYHIV